MAGKNSRSSAIAKKTRGAARLMPISEPNVEIVTTMAMALPPMLPKIAVATSAATSDERARRSIGRT